MPVATEPAMSPQTPGQPLIGNRGVHQKVGLDVDFASKSLKGWTEITITPTDSKLRHIRLNARQCRIIRCTIDKKVASQWKYEDPYANWKIRETASVHQHHEIRGKLERSLRDPPEPELIITIPPRIKIEAADSFGSAVHALNGVNSRRATPDVSAVTGGQAPTPVPRPENIVRIEYVVENIRDGFTFVGCEPGDMRYPHAFTTNSPLPGASCCLFPTIDGIHERWTWDIEVTVPKTLDDVDGPPEPQANGTTNGTTNGFDEAGEADEDARMDDDGDLDFVVVCSADFVDEEVHPTESWKKTVKFSQSQAVAPQHIAIAVGPFEQVNLAEYRDVENEESMGTMSYDVLGYALPGRSTDLRNSCMFLPKAIDYFVTEFGHYPFSAFMLCFIDDLATDTVEAASLVLCSNRLLFPDSIIDPIWSVTRTLTYSLSAQWAGVQVVPTNWSDMWVVLGIAKWMADCFLKTLLGNNDYRFHLKKDTERLCELDIGRPSLYDQKLDVPLDPDALEFMKLKSSLVLTILEKRLMKLSSSMVLHRVVRKIFLSTVAGELSNGLISHSHFQRLCEKNSHNKLDSFFNQWVKGSGYPRFEVSQRFNKKRMIVEMGIRQTQAQETPPRRVTSDDFLADARSHKRGVGAGAIQPVFTGPMTIRIHEADGTPYEHVVDIKEGYTKLDIPYNTKYKRLKRSRRQKERAAVGAGVDVNTDAQNDDVLLYCLGDVLQGDDDVDDWRLVDWSKEDEERMAQESFEWIRMDADFEWICTLNIGQPDYMFLSQLQQDRDVIAQYDSILHFASIRESALISTILVRTLMDRRYYYGIRVEAAKALARCATAELDWIGQFHLMKAFQEFFCFPGSAIPRGNDFSDFTAYYVQTAIPQAMSQIRNTAGECPASVQKWLLDVMRYSDNRNNNYADDYFIANLMLAMANTLTAREEQGEFSMNFEFEQDEGATKLQEDAIAEIERYQRMDQWRPTYRNIVSETALEIRKNLALSGYKEVDYRLFLSYTREGTLDTLRAKAFDCLVDVGALREMHLKAYICRVMVTDPSPYIRRRVQTAFGRGLGMIALGEASRVDRPVAGGDIMIVDDDAGNARRDDLAKKNIVGAMDFLKKELATDEVMKEALWDAVLCPNIGLLEIRYLLDICRILYDTKNSWVVKLKIPKHLTCRHLGGGRMFFKWAPKTLQPPATKPPSPPKPPLIKAPSIKLITKPKVNGQPAKKQREPKHPPPPPPQRQPSSAAPAFSPLVSAPDIPTQPTPAPTPPQSSAHAPPQQSRKITLKINPNRLQSIQSYSQPNGTPRR